MTTWDGPRALYRFLQRRVEREGQEDEHGGDDQPAASLQHRQREREREDRRLYGVERVRRRLHLRAPGRVLHVLQDGEFARLGGKRDIAVDVRVLASTNKPLERAVEEGWLVVFEHDAATPWSRLAHDGKAYTKAP